MQITKYFASFGFDIDKSSIKKVDKTLTDIEKRLKGFGSNMGKPLNLNIEKFTVDQKKMDLALGNALDIASARTVFEVSRFHINQSRLNGAMMNAMANASAAASRVTNLSAGGGAARRMGSTEAAVASSAYSSGRSRSGGGLPIGGVLGVGLAAAAGGYGLSALNKKNQEVVAAHLQTQAVVRQAGGNDEQAEQSFSWLRQQGNDIVFNYLKAAPEYNNLLANMTGAGYSVAQGQNVFKSFAELSRTYKLDPVKQQRVFLALSQIAGKGQLQSQELKLQLGQALPGAEGLFGQAYQNMIGGKLTGQESIAALLDAMKKGKVSSDILNYVSPLVHQKAVDGGLDTAKRASAAEQNRYSNTISDLAVVASNAGVEEGYARIFRTLTNGLQESNSLVTKLAEGFNDATKWADDLALWPQSFMRALDGKDSLVADWLGEGKTAQLVKDWQTIKGIFTDISALKFDFLPNLQSTTHEIAAILDGIAKIQNWRKGDLPGTESNASASQQASFMGFTYTSPVAIASDAINNTMFNINRARQRGDAVYGDPNGFFYNKPEEYDENQKNMAMDLAAQQRDNGFTTQISLYVQVDPLTLANMDIQKAADDLGSQLTAIFSQTQVHFPQKE